MALYLIQKSQMRGFVTSLMQSFQVITPVKTDEVRYEIIGNANEAVFDELPLFPLKKFFFAKEEVLFQFDGNKLTPTIPIPLPKLLFGVRRCDLNAIKHQDLAFTKEFPDPYYVKRREGTVLVGIHCKKAIDQWCFCGSMELDKSCQDLMLYEEEEVYRVEVCSEVGQSIISKSREFFTPSQELIVDADRETIGADQLTRYDLNKVFDRSEWKDGVKECIDCGACNTLCPTCYCFEIGDEPSLPDPTKGERKRTWSLCMTPEFTRVAGDHIFRNDLEDRFKHRIMHQLQWFKDKHESELCVGCGRCIRGCPSKIDFVKIINSMERHATTK